MKKSVEPGMIDEIIRERGGPDDLIKRGIHLLDLIEQDYRDQLTISEFTDRGDGIKASWKLHKELMIDQLKN